MHMVEYRRNQKQLRETPALPSNLTSNTAEAHLLLQQAIAEGATSLDTHEVQPILQAYGMNTLPTWIASDSTEAVHIAEQIGYPVALKLRSPDIPHKSEVQGVMLYLRTANEVQQAANAIFDRVKMAWPARGSTACWCKVWLTVLALRSCGWCWSTIRFSGR